MATSATWELETIGKGQTLESGFDKDKLIPELPCLMLAGHSTGRSGTEPLLLSQHDRKSCSVRSLKTLLYHSRLYFFIKGRNVWADFLLGNHFVHFKLVSVGAEQGCCPIGQRWGLQKIIWDAFNTTVEGGNLKMSRELLVKPHFKNIQKRHQRCR